MFSNKFKPLPGRLLISEPMLPDPVFRRSVILITKYDEEGAVGFILNKPVNLTLTDTLSGITGFNSDIFFGGPVQRDALFFLHRMGDRLPGSVPVSDGLFWGGNFTSLKKLFEKKAVAPDEIKFFIGYAGWSAGQLEFELKKKSWIIAPIKTLDVLNAEAERLWGAALKNMGHEYAFLANYPENPSLN